MRCVDRALDIQPRAGRYPRLPARLPGLVPFQQRPRAEHRLHFLSAGTATTPTAVSRSGHLYRARSAPHAVVGDRVSREPLDLRDRVPVVAALLSAEGGRSAARGM